MTAVDDPPGGFDFDDEDPPPHTDDDIWRVTDEWDRLEGMYHGPATNGAAPPTPNLPSPFVDWAAFWNRDRSEADYLLDDVIVRGRGHAIYAPHKVGKSLFTLWACVDIIRTNPDVVVIYLDYEMTENDLQERLEDMGVGPTTDLTRLHYWLLPTLPPLDSAHGSTALLDIVTDVAHQHPDHHIAVVIDTTGRAVNGDENDAGTFQDFYRLTGLRLKQMGVTWLRLDHEGKDAARGQRGSSAKGDDIDVAWRITKTDDGILLTRKLSRLSWVPEKVTFAMPANPLRYVRTGETVPAGTKEAMDLLDELDIPVTISANAAQRLVREAGRSCTRAPLIAAQKARKRRDEEGTR